MTALPGSSAVVVHVDVKLKAAWLTALARLKRAKADDASAFKVRYQTVSEIIEHSPPLYLAGGFATEGAFVDTILKEDRSTVYTHLRVAKLCSLGAIEAVGPTVLGLAIRCLEAVKGHALTSKDHLDFEKVTLPVPNHAGKVVNTPLEALTVSQLRGLLHRKNEKASAKLPEVKTVTKLLSRAGSKHATFSATHAGLTLHVSWDELAKVSAALAHFSR